MVHHTVNEWESKEFAYKFPLGGMWAHVGSGGYTEAGAKLEFWQNHQQKIRLELQKWLDDGWEPVGEIGSAGIRIRTFRSAKYSAFGWIWIALISVLLLGLPLLFIWSTYAEPVEFRLTMRRPIDAGTEVEKPAMIVIRRPAQYKWMGFKAKYEILIDEEVVSWIDNGATESLEVSTGQHSVQLKADWIQSNKVMATLASGETVNIVSHTEPLGQIQIKLV